MSCWMKYNGVYEKKRADQKNKTNVPLQVRSPFYEESAFRQQGIPFHLLFGELVQGDALETPGQIRNSKTASRIPDTGSSTDSATFNLCIGLSDAPGQDYDDGAETAGGT